MSFLSTLVLIFALLALGMLAGTIALGVLGWRSLGRYERAQIMRELPRQRGTIGVVGSLLLAPALLLGVIYLGFFPLPIFVMGVFLWSGVALWIWESRANRLRPQMWGDAAPIPFPQPPVPGPLPIAPEPVSPAPLPVPQVTGDDLVRKTYAWTFQPRPYPPYEQGVAQTIEMDVSRVRYEERKAEARLPRVAQWGKYVVEDMPECKVLAIHFGNLHLPHDWSTFEQASNVLAFTQQCITYSYDKDSTPQTDWPRYPIETLMEETGDCEDDSILTAAIMSRLGFRVALLHYPGHVAVGIAGAENLPGEFIEDAVRGVRYYYAETTSEGWHIGEAPKKYVNVRPEIVPVQIVIAPEKPKP